MTLKKVKLSFGIVSLVVIAAVINGIGDGDAAQPTSKENKDSQRRRVQERVAHLRAALLGTMKKESAKERASRRRFQSVLSTIIGDTDAIIVDVDRLKNAHLGPKALQCLSILHGDAISAVKQEWGVDLLSDVRRIALADEFVLIDGQVAAVGDGRLGNASIRDYGVAGKIVTSRQSSVIGHSQGGIWGNELLVLSPDLDEIQEMIDIADERESPIVDSRDDHSHAAMIYGTMTPGELFDLVGVTGYVKPISSMLDRMVSAVAFEIDVHREVLVRASLRLSDRRVSPLLLGGLERLRTVLVEQSVYYAYDELTALLDSVSVREGNGAIDIEWAMPLPFVEDELMRCTDLADTPR